MCIKSIETMLKNKAYEEIDTRRISELTTFRACIGTRIYGEECIHDIAEDKVNLAKRRADEVIPGIVCKILFHSFKILLLSIFLASIIYAFLYYISPNITDNENELLGYRISMTIIIYGLVLFYVYVSIKNFIYEKYNFIKQQIADAAG